MKSFFKPASTLLLFLIAFSCSKDDEIVPQSIEITASSTALLADGTDAISFDVDIFDSDDKLMENADYDIFVNGNLLNTGTFSTTEKGEYTVLAKFEGLESNRISINAIPVPESIEISASSLSFKADGNDTVEFEVTVKDSEEHLIENSGYEILVNGEILPSDSFSTTRKGEYEVLARIRGLESSALTLTAIAVPSKIELSASSTSLLADGVDEVSFEVLVYDAEEEVMEDAEHDIYVNGGILSSPSFSTIERGEYEVIAKIDELESNSLTLNAVAVPVEIKLSASSTTIMADGADEVSFEVEVYDANEAVIEEADYDIFIADQLLEGNSFSTTEKGEYTAIATIDELESNSIKINAITKAELVNRITIEASSRVIIADGISNTDLSVTFFDEQDSPLNGVDFALLVNNEVHEGLSFSTSQDGIYDFSVEVNNKESNILRVEAREDREYEQISVPVIFHVVHFGEEIGSGPNLTAAHIQALLDKLNAGFSNEFNSTNPNSVDTHIRFRLATLDQDDNELEEPGINRIDATAYDIGSKAQMQKHPGYIPPIADRRFPEPMMKNRSVTSVEGDIADDQQLGYDEAYKLGRETSWDRNDYYNVYILPTQESQGVSGYAYLPIVSESHSLEGFSVFPREWSVTIEPNEVCVIDTRSAKSSQSTTIIHEAGHSFGLLHTFSEDNCETSDFCGDTYSYISNNPKEACPDNNGVSERDNYMDYYVQPSSFTYDQRERMRHVFEYGYFYDELKNSGK